MLLCSAFLQLRRGGAALYHSAPASRGSGFSCCEARALGMQASVAVARLLYSVGSIVVAQELSCPVLVAQLCPTLWDPMDWSPPGPFVHGILQAKTLQWVAIPFSKGSS